jgi:hypothetical protein
VSVQTSARPVAAAALRDLHTGAPTAPMKVAAQAAINGPAVAQAHAEPVNAPMVPAPPRTVRSAMSGAPPEVMSVLTAVVRAQAAAVPADLGRSGPHGAVMPESARSGVKGARETMRGL